MIRFSLRCDKEHDFDSWFASGAAYDSLRAAGHVACPICGSSRVDKAVSRLILAMRPVSVHL